MRKSRFTEEQIVGILQEYAAGAKVSELCRKHGMSDATLYKWKAKYGGMTVSELRRLSYLMAPRLRPLLTPPNDGTQMESKLDLRVALKKGAGQRLSYTRSLEYHLKY